MDYKKYVADVKDFPIEGILFRDVTPLLQDGEAFDSVCNDFAEFAKEVEADVILLAKAVDGVYDDDPRTNPAAKKYDCVTIDEVIAKNLQVVDMTASILARDNKMPMWVFGLNEENSIVNAVKGEFKGTKVTV